MSRIINKTSKQYALSLSVLILTGCATATYVEPTEPAPALWQGRSGIKLAQGEWKTIPGKHEEESAFAINSVENVRTAVLEAPITFEDVSKMGYTSKTKTLPIGTPLYARQYTRHVTTTSGYGASYTKTQSPLRNPIEWCAEGNNFDKGKLTGWTCIFWQDPSTAYFASSSKGHPQSPVIGSDGSIGSLPVIKETTNVSFKSEFKAGLLVRQLRKKDVTVSLVTGGEINGKWVGNVASFQRKKWDENDSVIFKMVGGEFKLKAIRPNIGAKPTAVNVEVVTAPKSAALGSLSAEDQVKLLELLLKVAKQSGEGK